MKKLLLIIICFLSASTMSTAGELKIEVATVATSVKNLIPVGVSEKFQSTVGRLYCYSKIIEADGQNIKHLWYLNERKFGETILPVKARSYRTYSYVNIPPETKGKGRVNITTGDGKVLKIVEFLIE